MKIPSVGVAPVTQRHLQLVPTEKSNVTPIAQPTDTFQKTPAVVPITFAYDKNGVDIVSGKTTDTNVVHAYNRNLIGDLNNALQHIAAAADMIKIDADPNSQTAQDATEIKAAAQKASDISKMLMNYTYWRERQ